MEQKRIKVRLTKDSPYSEYGYYEKGDIGYVDGYVNGSAVIILENGKFAKADLRWIEVVNEEDKNTNTELAESEDERIRKDVISFVEQAIDAGYGIISKEKKEEWIAWLKKQSKKETDEWKEGNIIRRGGILALVIKGRRVMKSNGEIFTVQYPDEWVKAVPNEIEHFLNELEKQGEQNSVNTDLDELVIQLEETIGTSPHSRETIKDFFQRAVQKYMNCLKIANGEIGSLIEENYRLKEKQGEQKSTVIIPKFRVGDEIKTSNEESLTITKIDEKGYWSEDLFICGFDEECKWDLVEQKHAWSEEDEDAIGMAIIALDDMYSPDEPDNTYAGYSIPFNKAVERLKSLKDRYTWKPSKEQIKALETILYSNMSRNDERYLVLSVFVTELKKLKS